MYRRRSNGAASSELSMVKAVAQYINTLGYNRFPDLSPKVSIHSIDPREEFFSEYTDKEQVWLLKVDFTDLISDDFALELATQDDNTDTAPDAETWYLNAQASEYYIFLEKMFRDMTIGDFVSWHQITDQVNSIKKDQKGRYRDYMLTIGFSAYFVPFRAIQNWNSVIPIYSNPRYVDDDYYDNEY